MTSLNDVVASIHVEIGRRLPDLHSVWAGVVKKHAWRDGQTGDKDWECAIGIADWVLERHDLFRLGLSDRDLMGVLYHNITHEVLHAYSPGRSVPAYGSHRQLEEGVVEEMTRLWRDGVLESAGIDTEDVAFQRAEEMNEYSPVLNELRTIQIALQLEDRAFVEDLYKVSMERRHLWLLERARLRGEVAFNLVRGGLKRLGYTDEELETW